MARIQEPEILIYESPKIDVIELTSKDIVCLSGGVSSEGGGEFNGGWGN